MTVTKTRSKPTANVRPRKVTITELDDNEIEKMTIEDVEADFYEEADKAIKDWKKSMEEIITDGLKAMRKSLKESKARNAKVAVADDKEEVMLDWLKDYFSTMDGTLKRLDRLYVGKKDDMKWAVEAQFRQSTKGKVAQLAEENRRKKKTEKIAEKLNALAAMKVTGEGKVKAEIPVYQKPKVSEWVPPFEFPSKMEPWAKNPSYVASILNDFIVKNYNMANKSLKHEQKEPEVDGDVKDLFKEDEKKEKERKVIPLGNSYKLLQIKKNADGKERYFLCRRNSKKENKNGDPEDIFQDFLPNLSDDGQMMMTFAKMKELRKRNGRQRKISSRQQRKNLLSQMEKEEDERRPKTYANILRKNLKLKPEVADPEAILDDWKHNLATKDEDKENQNNVSPLSMQNLLEDQKWCDFGVAADIFKAWRHNLDVRRAAAAAKRPKRKPMAPQEENVMATAFAYQDFLRLHDPLIPMKFEEEEHEFVKLEREAESRVSKNRKRNKRQRNKTIEDGTSEEVMKIKKPEPEALTPIQMFEDAEPEEYSFKEENAMRYQTKAKMNKRNSKKGKKQA